MTSESAVQFDTTSRIHMALAVVELERSIDFYRTLFGQPPTKERPGYAKFEVAEPPVNLSLNQAAAATGPNNPISHFGIQVKSTAAVRKIAARLDSAGLQIAIEDNVTCCYAVQDKVWVSDPDGNKWEVYVVLDNDPAQRHSSQSHSSQSACCPGVPEVMEAVQHGDMAAAAGAFERAGGISACSCLSTNAE